MYIACVDYADGHAFGNIMKRHGEDQFSRPGDPYGRSFGVFAVHMEMWNDMIQQQQEEHTGPESHNSGNKGRLARSFCLIHGGNEQAPNGSRHHDTGGEARKGALHRFVQVAAHEKDAGGTQCGSRKRNQNTTDYFEGQIHSSVNLSVRSGIACLPFLVMSRGPALGAGSCGTRAPGAMSAGAG